MERRHLFELEAHKQGPLQAIDRLLHKISQLQPPLIERQRLHLWCSAKTCHGISYYREYAVNFMACSLY